MMKSMYEVIEKSTSPVSPLSQEFRSLDSRGLLASPKSGRQHFWIDLWNSMVEVSSLCITKSQKFLKYNGVQSLSVYKNSDTELNIHHPMFKLIDESWSDSKTHLECFHLDSKSLYQEVQKEVPGEFFSQQNWSLKFRDGMLVYVENGISRVICLLDELCLAQKEMIHDVLSVVYFAKLAGVSFNKIQQGVETLCGYHTFKTAKDEFTGSEFIDYSHVENFENCQRVLKYYDDQPIVILGGDYCALPHEFEEQLIAAEARLIHIIDAPKAQDPFLRRFIDLYTVSNLAEAVRTAFEITEEPSKVLVIAGIDKSREDRIELSQTFIKEVHS